MKRKVKDFFVDLAACSVLLILLCSFVLSFIFVKTYFYICVCVGILSTIVFFAVAFGKEISCE